LNSPYIETLPQHPCRVGGSKRLQIERCRIETGSLGDRLAETKHILLAIAVGDGNMKTLPFVCGCRSRIAAPRYSGRSKDPLQSGEQPIRQALRLE
jgi:hypothetical protein